MIKTKARTLERPRPGLMINADGTLFEQLDNGQTRTTSFGNFRGQQNRVGDGSLGSMPIT